MDEHGNWMRLTDTIAIRSRMGVSKQSTCSYCATHHLWRSWRCNWLACNPVDVLMFRHPTYWSCNAWRISFSQFSWPFSDVSHQKVAFYCGLALFRRRHCWRWKIWSKIMHIDWVLKRKLIISGNASSIKIHYYSSRTWNYACGM